MKETSLRPLKDEEEIARGAEAGRGHKTKKCSKEDTAFVKVCRRRRRTQLFPELIQQEHSM